MQGRLIQVALRVVTLGKVLLYSFTFPLTFNASHLKRTASKSPFLIHIKSDEVRKFLIISANPYTNHTYLYLTILEEHLTHKKLKSHSHAKLEVTLRDCYLHQCMLLR